MKIKFDSNRTDHFAGDGKMIVSIKFSLLKMEIDESDAGGLLGETNHKAQP